MAPNYPTHVIYRKGQIEVHPYVAGCPEKRVILVAKNFASPCDLFLMLRKVLSSPGGVGQ
jgi:hypothetical protein